jgi:hypothetical protein
MNEQSVSRHELRWLTIATVLIIALALAPIAWGYMHSTAGYHFSGVTFLPEDGDTYIAKIRQGMQGAWLYRLAYTSEPGPPLFLYTNYLLWGHFGAWLNWEPELVFAFARAAGGAVMLLSLYAFIARFFGDPSERRFAFLLATLGGGFGWLTLLLGQPTPDVLQPEMFPFASLVANAHFPLAIAATIWLLGLLVRIPPSNWRAISRRTWFWLVLSTAYLASAAAYALVIIAAVTALWLAVYLLKMRRLPVTTLVESTVIALVASPFALNYAWLYLNSFAYTGMERQDITPPFAPLAYLLAGGIVLPLAVVAVARMLTRDGALRLDDADRFLLVAWIVVIAVLIYVPFLGLQRRYSTAAFVPLAILAAKAVYASPRLNKAPVRIVLLASSALTSVVVTLVMFAAISLHEPSMFLTAQEWDGITYLKTQALPTALVLSSPQIGLYIPGWSGQRVIYGHPVETLDAQARRKEVEQFYSGLLADQQTFLAPVDYIFVGPRERTLGTPAIPSNFSPTFTDGDVTIYARQR